MKKIRIIIISIVFLVAFSVVCLVLAADYKYVGSNKSNKYHFPNCQWALKITPENLVKFNSVKEAQAAGYVPCKMCNPPTKD